MTRRARGFKVLSAAALTAMAMTFTAGCNDPAEGPDNGNEQQQEDGEQQQEQEGGQQQGGEQDDG